MNTTPTTADLIAAAGLLLESSWTMEPDEFDARLSAFMQASGDKLRALRFVAKAAESRAAGCKAEAAAYAAAAKAASARSERVTALAAALYCAAREIGEELPGGRMQANGGAVPLVYADGFSAAALPAALQRVTVEPNAEAIRAALARGEAVPGVELGERGEHFRWVEAPAAKDGR
jgi:hypothetical protein